MKSYENDTKQPTGATLFGGFEGVGLGMKAAGIEHAWSIEYNAQIAAVAQLNGFNTIVANIMDCDPADFEPVQFLHASPPCPNFSPAKANGEETELDIALAEKVAEFITVLLPDFFTLENVYQYRESKSWETIARALLFHGYQFNYWHCNMADWGVPQTRKRMIVIARRDGIRPQLPPATHAENPEVGLFGTLKKWVGWHSAIADLIPSLKPREKETVVAKYQKVDADNCLIDIKNTGSEWGKHYRAKHEPSYSITRGSCLVYKNGENDYTLGVDCVARFQSFPVDYVFYGTGELTHAGIGNAVSPLFAQRLFEDLL